MLRGGRVVKDQDGKLVMCKDEVIKVWENYFRELYNQGGGADLDLPSLVRDNIVVEEISDFEVGARKDEEGQGSRFGRNAG